VTVEIRRPDPIADFDEVLALVQACDRAVYDDSDWTAAELREEWDDLDLETDAWVAVEDGRLAGVVHVYGLRGTRVLMDGYVHPELTGRGAGSLLLEHAEARARELAAAAPACESIWAETAHLVGDPRAPELLTGRGYAMLRTYHRMIVDLEPGTPAPSWPDGLELRPFDPERHARQLKDALDEAFADEWGHEKRDYDAWAERVLGVPQFDPELVLVVWDAGEIAAMAVDYQKRLGDWGLISLLGVRPAWRRQGLGLSLLQESFRRFAERGETMAALGVDSENPTGATRLYERAGMRILWRADVWRKELRADV
jgi:ribosomal protein S18 acetylase RimI-like enzyme